MEVVLVALVDRVRVRKLVSQVQLEVTQLTKYQMVENLGLVEFMVEELLVQVLVFQRMVVRVVYISKNTQTLH